MAARVFDTQPDAARAALAHITAESRAALDDMRGRGVPVLTGTAPSPTT